MSRSLLISSAFCLLVGCALPGQNPQPQPWDPGHAVMPRAEFAGDFVRVSNVRNFRYAASDVFVPRYDSRIYDLRRIEGVDFIVVPFKDAPNLAHTMLSFGFDNGEYLAFSVEARRREGQEYSPISGMLARYELIYVLADERDVIPLRTFHHSSDTYLYRTRATPAQSQALFVDVLQRANRLNQHPEFYNTLTNNCTTNIRDHINHVMPGRVPWNPAVWITGRADRIAYDMGLLERTRPFDEAKRRALVNEVANRFVDAPDFSVQIRR